MIYFFKNGLWQNHIESPKNIYAERYSIALKLLKRHLPWEVTFTYPTGGLCIWVCLPPNNDAKKLQAYALKHGIAILPGQQFFSSSKPPKLF